MSKEIIEKLDAIEAKQAESITAVEAKIPAAVEAIKAEFTEMVSALEAKVAAVGTPAIHREQAKTVRQDVNRHVREQLKELAAGKSTFEKKLEIFADESQMEAYLKEASALTAGGDGKGGRTGYDPVFRALRLANPLRGVSRTVATDGSS
jgi:polyhydroxyalkanoate synthesis regulator phasin